MLSITFFKQTTQSIPSMISRFIAAIALFFGAFPVYSAPLPQKADLLAKNTVIARYEGTVDHPCMFRTALCPDRCDHATRLAQFRVLQNEQYEKNSKYGDDRMNPGDIASVDVLKDIPGQEEHIASLIATLKKGDCVRISIAHFYVHEKWGDFPVRPAVLLEPIHSCTCKCRMNSLTIYD